MNLTLKEKFVILAYDPIKGHNLASNYLGFGIGGAILLELAGHKKISIERNRIKLLDGHKTGDELLDRVITMISASSRPLRVKALITKIQARPGKFKKPIVSGLLDKRYLRVEHKRWLIFPYKRYPSANPGFRKEMVDYIRRLVLRNDSSDQDISLLTGLAGACRFAPKFFRTKEERKTANRRIKEIIKESQVDKAIDETIKAIQAAVLISVTTTAAVSAST